MFSQILTSGIAALSLAYSANAAPAAQAALVSVPNFGTNPTGLQMNIYVPTKVAAKPAVILALHGCFGNGPSYVGSTTYTSLADTHGFIVIGPSSLRDSDCWDVSTAKGLTRGGGSDNDGLAQMLQYTIKTYNADPAKIYVTGSSSGCMMTNVFSVTYPDLVAAATCYSGVAAGCLAGSPGNSPVSANPNCANGKHIKTQAAWVAQAKAMYPTYNGTYPKMLTFHGTADTLVLYANLEEEIKQWSGLLGVSFTKNITSTPSAAYTEMVFGDGTLYNAYSAVGVGHTVPVQEAIDLKWFGIA